MENGLMKFATIEVNKCVLEAYLFNDTFILESSKGVVWVYTLEDLVEEVELLQDVCENWFVENKTFIYVSTDDEGSEQVIGVFDKDDLEDMVEMYYLVLIFILNGLSC